MRVVGRVVEVPNFHHRKQLVARRLLFNQNEGIEQVIVRVHAEAFDAPRPIAATPGVVHFAFRIERPLKGKRRSNHRPFGVHHGERLGTFHGETVLPASPAIVVFNPLAFIVGQGSLNQFQGHHNKGGQVGVFIAVIAGLQ